MKVKRTFSKEKKFEEIFEAYLNSKKNEIISNNGKICYNSNTNTPYDSEVA